MAIGAQQRAKRSRPRQADTHAGFGRSSGPAPRGGEATAGGLAVIKLVLKDAAGAGLNDGPAGVNDVDAGRNVGVKNGSGPLAELVQAAGGTLARMPSTMTNRPAIRTVECRGPQISRTCGRDASGWTPGGRPMPQPVDR
jgi:hypothetical protein